MNIKKVCFSKINHLLFIIYGANILKLFIDFIEFSQEIKT